MAYQTGDTILDDHYNGFATSVNAMWGAGTGVRGFGQTTTVSTVSDSTVISAAQWTTLLNRCRSVSDQQANDGNITIDTLTDPSAGDLVEAFAAITTDIATLDTSAALAVGTGAGFGSAVTSLVNATGTFAGTVTQTSTLTFAGGNEARYFFNSGGKVEVSWTFTGGTSDTKYDNWVTLAVACGTYQIFANVSGKTGGSGSVTTNNTNNGYFDMAESAVIVFKQLEDTAPYTASYIQLSVHMNANDGTDGLGNNGTVMTVKSEMVDAAADQTSYNKNIYNVLDQVDGTKRTTFSFTPSATTYISATWGTPAWATTVNTET
jgi:hypothetical protein